MEIKIKRILTILLLLSILFGTAAFYVIVAGFSGIRELIHFVAIWLVLAFHPVVLRKRRDLVALICGVVMAFPIGSIMYWIYEIKHPGMVQSSGHFTDWRRHLGDLWLVIFVLMMFAANRAIGFLSTTKRQLDNKVST